MSNVSFKKFVSFVNLEGDVSDEQINEIFGLFKNNDKVEKLKKERERLKGMSDKKKAELDQALKDFKDGKKTMPKGALSHDVWDDALSGDDKAALARHDKDMARQAEKDKAEKDSGPKNRTGRNFYEAITTVKTITKPAYYRESALTAKFKAKLEKIAAENDVNVEYGKPRFDQNEGEKFVNVKLTGTRAAIKIVAQKAPLVMNDDSLNEGSDATIKAIKLKIDPDMTDAEIWNFIENQDEVTIEDFEKKGDTLYLYPYIDIEVNHPKLKGMQQRLQRMI